MTSLDLRLLLTRNDVVTNLWQLPDTSYEPVGLGWVYANWCAWLDARPVELVSFRSSGGKRLRDRPLWRAQVSDCDNLALGVMTHGQVGNALASVRTGKERGGLAFGVFFFIAQPRPENGGIGGGHAVNWFVDHDQNLRFFEPATGEEITLTTTERSSSWFGLAA